jgi:hypothetical protein
MLAKKNKINIFSIQKDLNILPWQIKDIENICNNTTLQNVSNLIEDLFLLDYNIKMDKTHPYLNFKKIILKNGK